MKATAFTSLSDYARKQTEEKWMSIPQTAQMSTMHSNKAKSPRQREPFGPILQLISLAEQKDYSFFNSMQDYAANSAQDSRDIYDSFDPMNFDLSLSVSKPYGSKSDCGKASFCDRAPSTALPNLFADGGGLSFPWQAPNTLAESMAANMQALQAQQHTHLS